MRRARTIRTVTKTISDDKQYNYYQGITREEWERFLRESYKKCQEKIQNEIEEYVYYYEEESMN